MKRLLFGMLGATVVTAIGVGCAEDPTQPLLTSVDRIQTSVAYTEILVGDSVQLSARALDEQGNTLVLFPTVTSDATTVVEVSPDTLQTAKPAPATFFFAKAVGFGTATLTATEGGQSTTIDIQTWPAKVNVTAPATIRAGETALLTAQAVDQVGQPVTGPDAVVYTWSSDNPDVVSVDAATGDATAPGPAGIAVIEVDVQGPASGVAPITVVANVPAAAAFSAASFGALGAGQSLTLQAVVTDAFGNENNNISELLGITAQSSDPAVATVTTAVVDTLEENTQRQLFVTVTAVAAGSADISGSVTTSEGTFALGPAPTTVIAPAIAVAAPSGPYASNITINGTGLTSAGFATEVLVDGKKLGNIISVSATQIVAQAPTFGTAGTWDLEVSVGGVLSNKDTWTQVGGFDPADFVPANDLPETAPQISVPALFTGEFIGTAFPDDFFRFTLSEDQAVTFTISWVPPKDLDFILSDCFDSADVFSFACYAGTFIDPSGGSATPTLTAGDYLAWVNDYDAVVNGVDTDVVYTFSIEKQ